MATDTRNDEEIQRDGLEELEWDARVAPNEIGVAVKNGVVTLMGHVDSFYKKWAAENAAHCVDRHGDHAGGEPDPSSTRDNA